MGGKTTRARHVFDGEGRLSTACRRFVAKIPFLHGKEWGQEQQREVEVAEEDGDSLNLCQRCKELDLGRIFNGAGSPLSYHENSVKVLSLGILDKNSPCALCRFFFSMRRPSLTGETTDSFYLRKDRAHDCFSEEAWKVSTLWTVRELKPSIKIRPTILQAHYMRRLWFLPQSPLSSDYLEPMKPWPEELTVKGLPVKETSVNYPLLRGWINKCEDHPNCNYRSSDPTRSRNRPTIRGIDCTTRKIVGLQPGDKYIALSYVWGNKPLPKNKRSLSNLYSSQRALPTIAPKVVEDAMIVVKELGQQYLWVDQYCIDQHNEKDKHAQISNMDHIYEGSHATIVAFSGDDSSCGLPGVSSTPRVPQRRFTSSGVTLLGFTPVLTRQSFEASIWLKRGWTFQEALLSRRLLIFAQEQVYFHCPYGMWAESLTPRPRMHTQVPDYSRREHGGLDNPLISILPLKRSCHPSDGLRVDVNIGRLLKLIEEYSRRQLSFQADALDAFRGLLSRVLVLTYWGVPCYSFHHMFAKVLKEDELEPEALFIFLQSLSWVPLRRFTYLGRREGFPSWSWLGWRTPVAFERHDNDLPHKTLSTVEIEDASGALLSLCDLIKSSRTEMERSRVLPERTTYLWLEGLVFTLGFQPGSSRRDGKICFCFDHPLGYSNYSCLNSCDDAPDKNCALVNFRLDVKGSEETSKRTLQRKWDCLPTFSLEYWTYREYYFLILDEGEDAAYCVGTLCIADTAKNRDLLEKLKTQVPYAQKKVRIG